MYRKQSRQQEAHDLRIDVIWNMYTVYWTTRTDGAFIESAAKTSKHLLFVRENLLRFLWMSEDKVE